MSKWILAFVLLAASLVQAAEPQPNQPKADSNRVADSRADLEARLELIKAKRQAALADYRYAEALKENAILKDAAYSSEEKSLTALLENLKKKAEEKKAQ
jgi:hypothetical protein